MSSLYPLPMRFPVPMDGSAGKRAREQSRELERGEYIDVLISPGTPDGWSFITGDDRATFDALPVFDRLEYRRAFAAQVELAEQTTTPKENA